MRRNDLVRFLGSPPKPTRVFIEFEIDPRTAFGLGDGKTLLQAARDQKARERDEGEAVNADFKAAEFDCTLRDNVLTVSTVLESPDLFRAVDLAAAVVHDLLIAAGLRTNITFSARYRRTWAEDGSQIGRSGWASHVSAQWGTVQLESDFRAGAEWLTQGDASFRSGLLYFRRATWVYEASTGSIRGNWESYSQAVKETGWAAAIAIMLLWKAVEVLIGEKRVQRRGGLSSLGFDQSEIERFEALKKLRDRVTHDPWDEKNPTTLNDSYGQLREMVRQLLMRSINRHFVSPTRDS